MKTTTRKNDSTDALTLGLLAFIIAILLLGPETYFDEIMGWLFAFLAVAFGIVSIALRLRGRTQK